MSAPQPRRLLSLGVRRAEALMRFQVYGVRDDTGRPIKPVVIKAVDEPSARERALRAGIRVERIDRLADEPPAPTPAKPATAEPAPPLPANPAATAGSACRQCNKQFSFWSGNERDPSDGSACSSCAAFERREAARVGAEQAASARKAPVGPPRWRYQMAQIPTEISVQADGLAGGPAAAYLERVIGEYAARGWEFYRVDEVGVQVSPGCLAALFGATATNLSYYVVTFRAPVADGPVA